MDNDNRKHPRINPIGLKAHISIEPAPPKDKLITEGVIIDMSYTGIKIKLKTPFAPNIAKGIIHINLTLPKSGVPITIRGMIKYLSDSSEYGLEYIDKNIENEVDDLMFECIKISADNVQENLESSN